MDNTKFEIMRRYSDFFILRETFLNRWPGLYIPKLPERTPVAKISKVNKKDEIVIERCFILNLFIR